MQSMRLNTPPQHMNLRPVRLACLVVLTALFMLLLAACGGSTLPESQPTALPATEPAPVAEAPTDSPVPTDVPDPTEVPATEIPATEPAPEPTEEPSAEPVANAVTGNCVNPYFPVTDGRTMVYESTDPLAGTTSYSITYGNTSEGGFTATFTLEGQEESFTMEWTCTEAGLLSPNLSGLLGDMEGIEVEVLEASGVTLPSADEMEVGATWSTNYAMRMTFSDESLGSMVMNQTIANSSEIVARESVTVPYGTFDALRIESSGTVQMAMDLEGTPMPAPSVDITSTSWYVEGIGMVREETPDMMGTGAGPSITELVDIVEAP